MCGFTGYFGRDSYNREEIVHRMGEKIAHRGPDGEGYYVDEDIALAFRRLSIIDIKGGGQPMHSAGGRYVLVFNGEIYNYRDLREILQREYGCVFQTESDTEVILQGYAIWGEDIVFKLRGMFAFLIYDKKNHSFFAARDHFGIKPFYYAVMGNSLMFGSEIKSFLVHPDFEKRINNDALKMYLIFQYSPLKETIFKNVYKLEAGHSMTYDGRNLMIKKYFDISYEEEDKGDINAAEEIDRMMKESVRYHQISDVEVGGFLSGGVDSSYITSIAKPDKTYSVGFQSKGFDETESAEKLCNMIGIHNQCKHIDADEFFKALPEVQYYSDEPHANLSAIPLYYLADMAAEDVKVVLSGEGADEFFGGYQDYVGCKFGDFYKRIVPRETRRRIGEWAKKRHSHRGLNFLKRNALDFEDDYIGHAFIMNNEEADALLKNDYKSEMRYQDVTKPVFDQVKNQDELHKKLYLDMHFWLLGDILLKADKMTMAHSLELRVPYLDREIWSFARKIKTECLVKNRTTKRLLRMAAEHVLPNEWSSREKKGFLVPVAEWFREDRYYHLIKSRFMEEATAQFFDRDILLRWLEEHRSGKFNNQRKIYTVYTFLVWYEQYFGAGKCA